MKKILTLAVLAGATAFAQAQGTIATYSVSGTYAVYTNTSISIYAGGTGTGGTSGKAALNSGLDYALLVEPYTGTLSTTAPLTAVQLASFTVAVSGITNYGTAGGIAGPGHNLGGPTAAGSWASTQDGNYVDGAEDYFVLVGWSSSLGSSWQTVETELLTDSWAAPGYFGVSSLGYGYSGGGPDSLPAPSIFGNSSAEPLGIAGITSLDSVVPEPSTIALAAMGGLSLLAFRRKKA